MTNKPVIPNFKQLIEAAVDKEIVGHPLIAGRSKRHVTIDEWTLALACGDSFETREPFECIIEWKEGTKYSDIHGCITNIISAVLDSFGHMVIQNEGGGEGGAEHCRGVFEWEGVYYAAEWRYQSYIGNTCDGMYEYVKVVHPHEEVITVYR